MEHALYKPTTTNVATTVKVFEVMCDEFDVYNLHISKNCSPKCKNEPKT
jgi:hypothetical protein